MNTPAKKLPVTVLSGFLGSGKTTFTFAIGDDTPLSDVAELDTMVTEYER